MNKQFTGKGMFVCNSLADLKNSFIWLLPTVRFAYEDGHLKLRKHTRIKVIENVTPDVMDFLKKLDGTERLSSLEEQDHFGLMDLLESLSFIVYLKQPIQKWYGNKHSRYLSYLSHEHRIYPDEMIEALKSKKVCIFGVGGIGSQLAQGLLGSGLKTIHLIDPDEVDATNINRQYFYDLESIGRPKVSAAKAFLSSRFPEAKITIDTYNCDSEAIKEFHDFDLIVIAGECHTLYEKPHIVGDTPVLRAGYDGNLAILGPLYCKKIGAIAFSDVAKSSDRNQFRSFQEKELSTNSAWNSSGSSINSVLGGLLTELALRILHGDINQQNPLHHVTYFDMKTFQISHEEWTLHE